MRREIGKLYETDCDVCDERIKNFIDGGKCKICQKDIHVRCGLRAVSPVFADNYSEFQIPICKYCLENGDIPQEVKNIIDKINKLSALGREGFDLMGEIENDIKELTGDNDGNV